MDIAKRIVTGIFKRNYEMRELDDSIFISLIKSGIENTSSKEAQHQLFDHALEEYIKVWLDSAKEECGHNLEKEKAEARRTFLKYWKNAE